MAYSHRAGMNFYFALTNQAGGFDLFGVKAYDKRQIGRSGKLVSTTSGSQAVRGG